MNFKQRQEIADKAIKKMEVYLRDYENRTNIIKTIVDRSNDSNYLLNNLFDSYHNFMDNEIDNIINYENPYVIENIKNIKSNKYLKHKIHFSEISKEKPTIDGPDARALYPAYCKLHKKDYMVKIKAKIVHEVIEVIKDNEGNEQEKIINNYVYDEPQILGMIPCMIRSKYCNLNNLSADGLKLLGEDSHAYGGYFIINGQDYSIVTQMRKSPNYIYLNYITKDNNKEYYTAFLQSRPESTYEYPHDVNVMLPANSNVLFMSIKVPKTGAHLIPLVVIFKALGISSDKDVFDIIVGGRNINKDVENIIHSSLIVPLEFEKGEPILVTNRESALKYIGDKIEYTYSDISELVNRVNKDIIQDKILPHLNNTGGDRKKCIFLAHMARKLLSIKDGSIELDDKDNLGNKLFYNAGPMLAMLWRFEFKVGMDELKNQLNLKKASDNLTSIFTSGYPVDKIVNKNIIRCMKKGEFPTSKSNYNDTQGVSQSIDFVCYLNGLARLRKCVIPLQNTQNTKNDNIHQTHGTHLAGICINDSPDGKDIGLTNEESLICKITVNAPSRSERNFLLKLCEDGGLDNYPGFLPKEVKHPDLDLFKDFERCSYDEFNNLTTILVNGDIVGVSKKPYLLFPILRKARREHLIGRFTEIAYYHSYNEIHLNTGGQRMMICVMPLIDNMPIYNDTDIKNIRNGTIKYNDLLVGKRVKVGKYHSHSIGNALELYEYSKYHNGGKKSVVVPDYYEELIPFIEYVGIHEYQESYMIALDQPFIKDNLLKNPLRQFHYRLIAPWTIFNINALTAPMFNMTQTPRSVYQFSHNKQTISCSKWNHFVLYDKITYQGWFLSNPLCITVAHKLLPLHNYPEGDMARVMIATQDAQNQEDSLIFNKKSVDNGLFWSCTYHSYHAPLSEQEGIFQKPDPSNTDKCSHGKSFDHLESDGKPIIGAKVKKGDAIIGIVQPIDDKMNNVTNKKYVNRSLDYKYKNGVVSRVIVSKTTDGNKFMTVIVKIIRKINVGDKFSSKAGQKGTVSTIKPPEDLPFTDEGERPDLIMNPTSLPKRMTLSYLAEGLIGNLAGYKGINMDTTVYQQGPNFIPYIKTELAKCGLPEDGYIHIRDPKTGRKKNNKVFMGWIYYQRLKYMSSDKLKPRDTGAKDFVTKQPTASSAKDSGKKIGEMEKDAIIANNCPNNLRSMFYDKSDGTEFYVSNGSICPGNPKENIYGFESGSNQVFHTKLGYSTNLAINEMRTLMLEPYIVMDPNEKFENK